MYRMTLSVPCPFYHIMVVVLTLLYYFFFFFLQEVLCYTLVCQKRRRELTEVHNFLKNVHMSPTVKILDDSIQFGLFYAIVLCNDGTAPAPNEHSLGTKVSGRLENLQQSLAPGLCVFLPCHSITLNTLVWLHKVRCHEIVILVSSAKPAIFKLRNVWGHIFLPDISYE